MDRTEFLQTFKNIINEPAQLYGRTHDTHIGLATSEVGGIHVVTAPMDTNDGRVKPRHLNPQDVRCEGQRRILPGVGFYNDEDLTFRNDGIPIHLGRAAITRERFGGRSFRLPR